MNSQLATIEESHLVELRSLDTEALKSLLSTAIDNTASTMLRLAAIIRVLEERGEDLSDLRFGLKTYLRRIAYGHLLPGVVVRFAEYPALMQRISRLPLDEQRRIADGEPVKVVVGDQTRDIDPLQLNYDQVLQVFGQNLRTEAEQRAVIEDRRTKRRDSGKRRYNVRVDRARENLLIGRASIPISEVLTALSEAAGWQGEIDEDHPDTRTASAKLTPDEKERLKALAKATNLPEWEIVRRAVLTWLI